MISSKGNSLKILTLTDFKTHQKGESIYELLKTMRKDEPSSEIFVASRHLEQNVEFFRLFSDNKLWGKAVDSKFKFQDSGNWFNDSQILDIQDFDFVFLRLDRPCSNKQLDALRALCGETPIINDPLGIQITGSKRFLLKFPDLTPPCGMIKTFEEACLKAKDMPIVLKPIEGYGGIGLMYLDSTTFKIGDNAVSKNEAKEYISANLKDSHEMLWMSFLHNVTEGDKRVLVVDEDVLGATLRLPAKDSWLCNLKQGGTASAATVDATELHIAKRLIPEMKKHGVIIFGFDTLVDNSGKRILSEINTLNVGGLIQVQELSKKPVISLASKGIWRYIHEKARK